MMPKASRVSRPGTEWVVTNRLVETGMAASSGNWAVRKTIAQKCVPPLTLSSQCCGAAWARRGTILPRYGLGIPTAQRQLQENGNPPIGFSTGRRQVSFITPIPKPKKRTGAQQAMVFAEEARRIAGDGQQYELAQTINSIRNAVDRWRALPDPGQWRVTPETARLLNHWRPP